MTKTEIAEALKSVGMVERSDMPNAFFWPVSGVQRGYYFAHDSRHSFGLPDHTHAYQQSLDKGDGKAEFLAAFVAHMKKWADLHRADGWAEYAALIGS